MRLKFALISVTACTLSFAQAGPTSVTNDQCAVPAGLRDEISRKYLGTRVVGFDDLTEYKRKLFQKHHGNRCPGLVRINFYGDGKPTWALVLISGQSPNRKAELVVARQLDEGWEARSLSKTEGTPVVWSEAPGKYEDLYENKTIRAGQPVIVFCGLESWAVVYAWNGKEVEKVQLSD